jgi:hypothetical protein
MFLKKITYLFFFVLLLSTQLKAQQETIITGRVYETTTNRGIPFVNIFFKGTFIGTTTDFEGNYIIKTKNPKDSIYISQIGYKSEAKAVKKGAVQIIGFQLSPEALNLGVIEVRPGINPALRIIRNTIHNKSKCNRDNLESIQFLSYTKQEADVDNITARMRKRKILRPVTSLWDSLNRGASEDSMANLPVMMSEIVSEIYYYKDAKHKRENVNAVKVKFVGMKDGSAVSQLTGTDFQNFNFCNNNVPIQGKDFLSPIADNALLFYNYYLIDSMFIDSTKCYRVDVRPKNKKDLAYTGTIWITDTTFAIKQLDLEITKDVNFNLVDEVRIRQQLIPTSAGVWVPSQTSVTVDYAKVTKKLVSLITHTYNCNRYFVVNQPKEKKFYDTHLQFAEDAIGKDSSYWKHERPKQLTPLESKAYNMIDTVRKIPIIKTGANALYFLFSGYINAGPVDFGHYMQVYAHNQYEGTRLRLGFRTNAKFSKSWIIRGYGAYGFTDKKFKYNLQLERIITRYPWSKVGAQYRDDIDQIGVNYDFSRNTSLTQPNYLFNTISQIGDVSKLVHKMESRIWYEKDFGPGINTKITLQNIRTTPLFPVEFGDQTTIFQQRKYAITELALDTRLSAKERYVQNGTERISLGNNKSPIVLFSYTLGIKHLFDGDFNYQKASISVSHRIKLSVLGFSQVYVKIGKVFSQIPYPLLEIPRGNETSVYATNAFNQMNFFEFVTDQYAEVHWQHHFMGLIFNRIPLLKKLNLREVVGINVIYGTLSDKNKNFNSNNNFTIMNNMPYAEANFGVENILDIIKIDFVYRLTYTDVAYKTNYEMMNPGNAIHNWGFKIGTQFAF